MRLLLSLRLMSKVTACTTGSARILLIDDNHCGLLVRKTLLEESGHEITVANTPEDGLVAFFNSKFDLVITDYRMPKMNGRELIAEIRKTHPQMPVILISGVVEPLGLNEQNTGADIVVAKNNLEVTNLTRAVTRLLKRKTPKKPVRSQTGVARAQAKGY